jgi:NitT/TauT family transport system ATP-binding protein
MQAIEARDVSVSYALKQGEFTALSGVSLQVADGEFATLIGPSGCGKSTLLRVIANLIEPTSGQISIFDRTPEEARRARQFGFVFQDPVLLPWKSAEANVALPMRVAGATRQAARDRAALLLELVGLGGFEKNLPATLSGGMARRVAIARALTLNPAVLMLDEPFNGLDEIRRQHLNEELQRVWMESGSTALLVTHNVSEAVFLSDRVFVMAKGPGRIIAEVEIDLRRPRTPDMLLQDEFLAYVRELSETLSGAYALEDL